MAAKHMSVQLSVCLPVCPTVPLSVGAKSSFVINVPQRDHLLTANLASTEALSLQLWHWLRDRRKNRYRLCILIVSVCDLFATCLARAKLLSTLGMQGVCLMRLSVLMCCVCVCCACPLFINSHAKSLASTLRIRQVCNAHTNSCALLKSSCFFFCFFCFYPFSLNFINWSAMHEVNTLHFVSSYKYSC